MMNSINIITATVTTITHTFNSLLFSGTTTTAGAVIVVGVVVVVVVIGA